LFACCFVLLLLLGRSFLLRRRVLPLLRAFKV
jgi:hypothetical protein